MLRLIGLAIILVYTGMGAMLVVGSAGVSRTLGLGLVLMGVAWLLIDGLKRRAVT